MIVSSPAAFRSIFEPARFPKRDRATARGVMLVEPTGMRLSGETSTDNLYMDRARTIDPERALAQHRVLADAIRRYVGLPVQVFPGSPDTPDAVFPNNVFACAAGRLVIGAMRHPERQRESHRADIAQWFASEGYETHRIDRHEFAVSELTGPTIIDRARRIGFFGLTERMNREGVRATHDALGLLLGFEFALKPDEYHTNVVMSVLASRALVAHRDSFEDPEAPEAIAEVYEHAIWLSDEEKRGFAGNCLALDEHRVFMSATAERALSLDTRRRLDRAGFTIYTVDIDEIEKAGGSLRCCIAEIF